MVPGDSGRGAGRSRPLPLRGRRRRARVQEVAGRLDVRPALVRAALAPRRSGPGSGPCPSTPGSPGRRASSPAGTPGRPAGLAFGIWVSRSRSSMSWPSASSSSRVLPRSSSSIWEAALRLERQRTQQPQPEDQQRDQRRGLPKTMPTIVAGVRAAAGARARVLLGVELFVPALCRRAVHVLARSGVHLGHPLDRGRQLSRQAVVLVHRPPDGRQRGVHAGVRSDDLEVLAGGGDQRAAAVRHRLVDRVAEAPDPADAVGARLGHHRDLDPSLVERVRSCYGAAAQRRATARCASTVPGRPGPCRAPRPRRGPGGRPRRPAPPRRGPAPGAMRSPSRFTRQA